ncbi:UNVERIFIED_CONTAM: putative inactive receptor kinase [Sesamum calycinum]|uniref:Inactive receptor kinase n=1 Tax=Sesamum calycinum TaxID=2727403 RepID=A0AAW2JDB1_9LAMI
MATMQNGVKIVVKRLKYLSISEPEFKHQMEFVGNVRHENVAALRACYSSANERLMLYDYYDKGSVFALLHGKRGTRKTRLSWETRLRIGVGAARAIVPQKSKTPLKYPKLQASIALELLVLASLIYHDHGDVLQWNALQFCPSADQECLKLEEISGIEPLDASRGDDMHGQPIQLRLEAQLEDLLPALTQSPSVLSEASDVSSSFNSSSLLDDEAFQFLNPASSSINWDQTLRAVVKSQEVPPKMALISDFSPTLDIEDVFRASGTFLGSGTFGSTYLAARENGLKVVVKRLKPLDISEVGFKRQIQIVGNVRHENVAAVRAYYSSKDERLLLYDYYCSGSVFTLLHGQTGENPAHVDWEARLRIAMGAAWETTFTGGALCHAPEVKNTKNVSQASDVYSFGILLLELLTRKSPVHVPGGPKAVYLVKLVSSVRRNKMITKVFDADLLKHHTIREQMVKVLQIGISCVAKSLKKRPNMSEIVKMLEDLSAMNISSGSLMNIGCSVSSGGKLVFAADETPTFDLGDILRAYAKHLGIGTFGTSYMVNFGDGGTFMVKRLRGVNVTYKEFKQHMEVIGRLRHDNVSKLKAYCFSKSEVLLVYEYHNRNSISALLHGKGETSGIHLDWKARLRIVLGAARGIAHIHTQDGLLVHGNIKSSNIFLNGENYGLVSDAGLAKLVNPIRPLTMRTSIYSAPEAKDPKKVSQASDIYSFGVFAN